MQGTSIILCAWNSKAQIEKNPITNLLADALADVIHCGLNIINSGIINGGIRKGEISNKKLLKISPSPLNPTYMEIAGKYIKEALRLCFGQNYA